MKSEMTFLANEINLSAAYQMGRVDALLGDPPIRFSAEPWSESGSTPDFHCAVTKTEAADWPQIRERYAEGYKLQSAQISKPAILK